MKIKFQNEVKDDFYTELKSRVDELLFEKAIYKKRLRLLYFKAVFYYGLFFSCYGLLFTTHYTQLSFLVLHYVVLGLSGVLLAFNVAHDATHGSFSKNKMINKLI